MPPRGRVTPLQYAVRDEARERRAHLARRTGLLEAARRCRAFRDRLDNCTLDPGERGARQRVGGSREPVRGPRLDPRDRGNHAAVRVRNRNHVVGREEFHQLQMRAIEQRPRLENFEDRLQLRSRKPFADLGDHSSHLAGAQRREHAMPRLDLPVERRGNRIRQRLESARRSDDHNIGLHRDSLCAPPKGLRACNLHPARAMRRVATPVRPGLDRPIPAFAGASSLVESGDGGSPERTRAGCWINRCCDF